MFNRILFSLSVLTLLSASCGSAMAPEPGRAVMVDEFTEMEAQEPLAGASAMENASFDIQDQTIGTRERIVIKNASLSIVVKEPNKTMDVIGKMAEEMGGFIVSANLYQTRLGSGVEVPRASITIRVPAEQLDEAIGRIETESDHPVESKTIDSQDVTSEYVDLQSRLRNLEAAEAQLAEIMDEAYETEDVLSVYNELVRVQEQIEVIKGQIKYYDESARFSSISVEIIHEGEIEPLTIGGWQPAGVARDAVQALINALQFLVNVTIWLVLLVIPVLLVIGTPPALIIYVILRWRKRRMQKQVSKPASLKTDS